ncbi:MAG: DUF4163 domain-containing protein [Erythrobacter sp.]|nr:DUF4163 domain-containing protein [Erythrobacter sp.]
MRLRFTAVAIPALLLAPLLAGCDLLSPTPAPTPTLTPTPSATDGATTAPVGGARQVSEQTDLFVFAFSYPQAAGEVEPLARWLDARLDRERNRLATVADQGRTEARDNGFPFNTYASETAWEVVANLPDWLSLSAELSTYEGGAHPNYSFDTIVWDKARDRALEPIAFFTSPDALDRAMGSELCDALNAERAQRRGEPVEEGSDDPFDGCIKPDEGNLLLGSSNGQSFDRIGIQIAPYLAGPYAEGSYEFTFPVTPAILDVVREEYRPAFAVARN